MANLNPEQFQALLAALPGMMAGAGGGGNAHPQGAASAVGPMAHCNLGIDKMTRLKRFNDWIKGAQAKIDFMGLDNDRQKISLLRSWSGPDLLVFWEREVNIRFADVPAVIVNGVQQAPLAAAHTYNELIDLTRTEILRHVNRDRSIIDLVHMRQKEENWMTFIHDLEEAADLCQLERAFTRDDAIRVAALAGMKDRNLAEKALAEGFDLHRLIQTGSTRETSKATADALQGRSRESSSINRLESREDNDDMSEGELDRTIAALTVRKMKKAGKYSSRKKDKERPPRRNETPRRDEPPRRGVHFEDDKCNNCTWGNHDVNRCPARGKDCFDCGGSNHFAGSPACSSKGKAGRQTARRVEDYGETLPNEDSYDSDEYDDSLVMSRIRTIRLLRTNKPGDKVVNIDVGGSNIKLFTDTGSPYTIIPPELYRPDMGEILWTKTQLRAWGSKGKLDVRGKVRTSLTTQSGAEIRTNIYIVAGHKAEGLLGSEDAESLGIITFNPLGRKPIDEERSSSVKMMHCNKDGSMAEKIRNRLGVKVRTNRPPPREVPSEEVAKVNQLVEDYLGTVFTDRVGCLKIKPIELDFDPKFRPTQPPYRPIPYHYREKISEHLQKLRDEGVITDVDPKKSYDCVMNVVVTEKAKPGELRMNIDSTPQNPGMRRTKYHVRTAQEARHNLEGATIFSEMDMGLGFH